MFLKNNLLKIAILLSLSAGTLWFGSSWPGLIFSVLLLLAITILLLNIVWRGSPPFFFKPRFNSRGKRTLLPGDEHLVRAQKIARLGHWVWDIKTNELSWSDEIYRIFGLEPQSFGATYEAFLKSVHPEDRDFVKRSVNQALEEERDYNIGHRILRPDGSIRFVHEQSDFDRDENGKIVRMVGTVQDITERRESEDLSARFGRIMDNSFHEIYVFHFETLKFIQVNLGARKNLGYSLSELRSMTPLDLKPDFDRQSFDSMLEPLRDGTLESIQFETTHKRKDGTLYPVDVRLHLSMEGGSPLFVANIMDITNQKAAEENLKNYNAILERKVGERTRELSESNRHLLEQNEEKNRVTRELHANQIRLKTVMENVVDGIITMNREGIIESFNAAAARQFGYKETEVVGKNVKVLMPEPYQSEHDDYLAKFNRSERTDVLNVSREVMGLRKNGQTFPMELWVDVLPLEEEIRFVGVTRDITSRKNAERELVRSREHAEKASRAKSDFLSRMSHELRTPLNAILGFGQLMKADKVNLLPERQRIRLKEIMKAGHHLLELINEVLDLNRVESGKISMTIQNVNPDAIILEVVNLTQSTADEFGVRLIYRKPEMDGPVIKGDPLRIKQVLLNLTTNAIKYNHKDGTVTVDYIILDDDRVRIRVADTGPGISPEDRNKVFQPFNRLKAEQSGITGTGIGLTISRKLVEESRK